ncbi:TonB-dependent receptor [Thalassomonas viridans]|uniref:TonB-dependent receptor n=1 Tax=Thalassomonas viridans TaxID=137584 RepID=A0AAF0CD35_9GAMM|nr:TonB-dependent receptor [Thalassomonas viridans]WDE08833.1 TonB-dependent receptor [Thalassomonas viridans]
MTKIKKTKQIPKLSYLSMLVMFNLGAAASVSAEDTISRDNEENVERITVTGIRGSLVRAMDLKKSSDGVVDGISAEDIGKFPDQNVAESLQRISGVAIDRESGEGQLVSVRGLGPEFNAVQVNGRTMATISGGRAFSFDTLASELINGAEVHKTQTGKLQEGSIGATINITTHRPLTVGDFKAVSSAKSTYDELSGNYSPSFSGLVSNIFDDGKFGVLASFAYSDRDSRSENGQTAGYITRDLSLDDGTTYSDVYMPRNYDQIVQTENRERTSGSLVLQYAPSEELVFTADALYSQYDVSYRQDILAHWFDNANIVDATLDENNTVVKLDSARNSATDYLNRLSERPTTTKALAFNMDWQLSDNLTLVADASYSEAESLNGGRTTDTVAGFVNAYSFDNSTGSSLPSLTFAEDLNPAVVGSNWASQFGDDIEDEILELKLDAEWLVDRGALAKVNTGVFYSDRTLATTYYNTNWRVSVLHGGYPEGVDLPDELFTVFDADGFLSGAGGGSANQWLKFDSYEFMDFLLTDAAINGLDDPAAARETIAKYDGFTAHAEPDAYKVSEEVAAAYVDFTFSGDLGDMPWQVVTGLRYVETTTRSKGAQTELLNLVDVNNTGDYQAVESDDYRPVSVKNTYDHLLPSINANIEPIEDVILRFAYSESITRPTLTEMSPSTSYGGGKLDSLNASGGNPRLKPYESENIDLSAEWYFDEASYLSLAYFTKDVDNFIDDGVSHEVVTLEGTSYNYTVSRPMNLNSTDIDGYELAFQHTLSYLPAPFDGLGLMANMTFVESESSADEVDNPLPLPGLGDSQNLVLFYEKGDIQFRVAYNNREEFMQRTTNWAGGAPIYVEDYAQVDVSGSYDINENFTVFFEGINVTNEITRKRGLYENHVLAIVETGPRWSLGVRAAF